MSNDSMQGNFGDNVNNRAHEGRGTLVMMGDLWNNKCRN